MSDKQKALLVLALLNETCTANITPLQQTPSSSNASSSITPSHALSVLRKDFLSLLTLIYNASTKVALTLRPSEPAYSAALGPLRELASYISSLTTCALLFDEHGLTLAKDVQQSSQDVCKAVKAFAQTFITITEKAEDDAASSSNVGSGEDYLVRTGAIHELVERTKSDLPEDNVAAVRKRYAADVTLLEDSLKEVADMIEDVGGDEGFEDEDAFEDELEELGLGPTKALSDVELERVKKIQPLLRMLTLLHKRIMLDLLKKGRSHSADFSRRADFLLDMSNTVLLAHEEVIAVLYAPQRPEAIAESLTDLATAAQQAKDILLKQDLLPPPPAPDEVADLEKRMAAVSVTGDKPETPKKERDVRKWFDTCFEQIFKLCQNVGDSIASESTTA